MLALLALWLLLWAVWSPTLVMMTAKKEQADADHYLGEDHRWSPLVHKCVEKRDQDLIYKVCFFKSARQDDDSLGYFEDWQVGGDKSPVMLFTGGSPCGGGTERSMRVVLTCGWRTELLSVKPPSKCVYEAVASDIGACSPEEKAKLKAEEEAKRKAEEEEAEKKVEALCAKHGGGSELDMAGKGLGDAGARALAKALKHNTSLQKIQKILLSSNNIGNDGAKVTDRIGTPDPNPKHFVIWCLYTLVNLTFV